MRSIPSNQNELSWWLSYIDSISASEVELGLDRVGQVAEKLGIQTLAKNTIVVAGTNGKGSCIAAMESILKRVGCSVGTYTSPHISRFSERIKLNGVEVGERQLCAAFNFVDHAREDVKLTYFEFSTLVAFVIFAQSQLDFALLEVGLGGRLDAVNIIDADVSIITSIDLDHQDWLGDDRESIGREKAGIIRKNKPVLLVEIEERHNNFLTLDTIEFIKNFGYNSYFVADGNIKDIKKLKDINSENNFLFLAKK